MPARLRLLVPLFLLLLSSCSLLLSHDFHVAVASSPTKVDAQLASLTVLEAPMDQRTGNTLLVRQEIIREWHIGLEDAVIQSAIFTGNPNRRLSLTVNILDFRLPLLGFSVTADVTARYELIDEATGATLYSKPIASTGYVPFDYAFAGFVRGHEAQNRGVRNNIKAFIADLEKALAEMPTIPAQPGSGAPRS